MDDIIKPKIDLRQQQTIKCEKCESKFGTFNLFGDPSAFVGDAKSIS